MFRRLLLLMLVALVAMVMSPLPGAAGGVSPAKLAKAGWECVPLGPLGVHCVKGSFGDLAAGEAKTVTVRIFAGGDPTSDEAEFLGTELLVHESIFNGQPCPQDGGEYHYLGAEGLPYYACHHYDTTP